MKKIVILDFDGTIADTKPVILNTFHRTFDAMHLPQHSDEEIAATIGLPLVEAYLFVNLADLIKMAIGIALLRRGIWVRNIVTGEKIAAKSTAG